LAPRAREEMEPPSRSPVGEWREEGCDEDCR